jgi:molecular chaperone GrpE (heat shock protein)
MDEYEVARWLRAFHANDLQHEHEREIREILRRFVGVLNSFDRCIAALEGKAEAEPGEWDALRSIELVQRQLTMALEEAGVSFLACKGQMFDPTKHEAVELRYSAEQEEPIILEEIECGCEWLGELLCRAKVVVATKNRATS